MVFAQVGKVAIPAAPAMVPRKKVRRVDCCEFMAGILHYGFSVSASDSRAGE